MKLLIQAFRTICMTGFAITVAASLGRSENPGAFVVLASVFLGCYFLVRAAGPRSSDD